MRTFGRLIAALAACAVTVVTLAAPAWAHATLESSDPPAGAVLTTSPRQITLRFDEPVEVSLGAIRVFDARGKEIPVSPPSHPGGTGSLVATNVPELAQGGYVVAWRVVSADSHPVHAAFTFQVGTGPGVTDPNLVGSILASEGGDRSVGVALGVARFVAYAALAVLVGGMVFVAAVWPGGAHSRRTKIILWTALVAGVVATAMGIALQAPYAEGAGLSRMFEPSGWRAVVDTRSGRAWEARLLLLLLVGTGLLATIRRVRTTAWRLVAGAAGVALIVAYAESGHGGVGRAPLVGLVVTVAHLAAMSVWVGGLVLLALVVLRTPSPAEAIGVTRRFSAWAFAAVVVVVASGLVQAWRQVGSLHAATSTTYGRTLLVKTALVVVLVGVGALSRLALQRRLFDWRPAAVAQPVGAAVAVDHDRTGVDDDASVLRRLRRTVGAEVVLAGAVLAVTSLLVAAAPAVSAATGPFNTSVVQGSRIADISIIPAGVGRNTTHIYIITPSGSLDPASSIDVSITNLDRNIGPLPVPVEKAGPNHVTTDNMQIPFPGTWRIDVAAVFGQFDQVDFLATFHV